MRIYLDGQLLSREEAKISVFDHAFLYGDGVFEGIRVYDGNVFRLRGHIERLYESAHAINLEIPLAPDELIQATVDTVAANDRRDGYIRLVISRGIGDLGIDPLKCGRPSIVIIVDSIALYPEELYTKGIPLVTASHRRIPADCLDPRMKSLNYLNNILAKIEATNAGCPEAIMLNTHGRVAECTADNLFIVKRGVVSTPHLVEGALAGITRGAVLELAQAAGFATEEGPMTQHDLFTADECFLTGTGAEIVPVVTIDGRTIGTGKAGNITRQLLDAFRTLRLKDGTRVEYASS